MAAKTFIYGVTAMQDEYTEMVAAKAAHEGDPVAQLLIEQEGAARMNLGESLQRLHQEALSLAARAQAIAEGIDSRGMSYTPNSLGEIQGGGSQVDTQCAKTYVAHTRLESAQKALREHLAARNDGTVADGRGGWISSANHGPVKPKRISKAQALVDSGLADNLRDARAQLEDMGE